jgi:hypothetical protein
VNLYQASNWFFTKSESSVKRSLWLSGILLLLALLALTPLSPVYDTVLVLVIVTFGVWQMWSKYHALYWFAKGDEPRRMEQFRAGLGHLPSVERCASIEQITGQCNLPINEHYWASNKPVGSERMVEMILESSFYTRALAAKCRDLLRTIGTTGLVACIAVIVAAYQLREVKRSSELISHIILTVFIFFLTGDFWILSYQYNDLFQSADDSHRQAVELAKGGNASSSDVLELAMSYNSAIAQSPPLFSGFHQKSQVKQNDLFKRHYGALLGL